MVDRGEGSIRMSTPPWIEFYDYDAVQYAAEGPRPVRLRVGLVRSPDSGDIRIASQVDERDLFILPPKSTAQIIGVLRRGLTESS